MIIVHFYSFRTDYQKEILRKYLPETAQSFLREKEEVILLFQVADCGEYEIVVTIHRTPDQPFIGWKEMQSFQSAIQDLIHDHCHRSCRSIAKDRIKVVYLSEK